ncbi:hypothetical protein NDU88_005419 [Pleurodeles waltl]|uniref:Uncharacterized protein n=1 Tax=Pleurodeles waltl TaxID=8319 RepID=A0AAV7MGU2_PLEWA|nr:hypothetical protein NDU88_005419 [Pleurodeles waltl]
MDLVLERRSSTFRKPRTALTGLAVPAVETDWAREDMSTLATSEQDNLGPEMGTKLQHIFTTMQLSLTKINGKINSLSYNVDRMSEGVYKHVERLDEAE